VAEQARPAPKRATSPARPTVDELAYDTNGRDTGRTDTDMNDYRGDGQGRETADERRRSAGVEPPAVMAFHAERAPGSQPAHGSRGVGVQSRLEVRRPAPPGSRQTRCGGRTAGCRQHARVRWFRPASHTRPVRQRRTRGPNPGPQNRGRARKVTPRDRKLNQAPRSGKCLSERE